MSAPIVSTDEKDLTKYAFAIQQLAAGRSNAVGSVTLTANETETVVEGVNIGAESYPLFVPLTANAAAEMGAGTMYISARAAGSFTITHADNAQTDRDYGFVCLG